MVNFLQTPPATTVLPVTEELHGVAVTDPFRWLENQGSVQTREWLKQQQAYGQAYFESIPDMKEIRSRVKNFLTADVVSDPRRVGNRYFFSKRTAYQEQPAIVMREGEDGPEITLIDPSSRAKGSITAVRLLNVSRDGTLLAYCVRESGEDLAEVEIFDVLSKRILPDKLPFGQNYGLVFSDQRKGFYYSHDNRRTQTVGRRAICWHELGTPLADDREICSVEEKCCLQLNVLALSSQGHLIYSEYWLNEETSVELRVYVLNISSSDPPRLVLKQGKGVFRPMIVGNRLIVLTNWDAPKCRVVAIHLDNPDTNDWQELIPQTDLCIREFAATSDRIAARCCEKGFTSIRLFDFSGQFRGTLPIRKEGTTSFCWSDAAGGDTLLSEFSSFAEPPRFELLDVKSGSQKIWATSQIPIDSSSLHVRHLQYPSRDGELIPLILFSQAAKQRSGPRPTVLTAYGGFGGATSSQFSVFAAVLAEKGCLFGVAGVRGGSELGTDWHLAGKRRNRQKSIDDLVSATEWLIAENLACPDRLAIAGGSNGGLLVAAAMTQRPDLFRAVLCVGPILDMVRFHKFGSALKFVDEYGSPDNPDDFQSLFAYSPYHRVRDGVAYPAVLFVSGDADTRCDPLHVRKMTARMQRATTSNRPIVVDYGQSWGHAPGRSLSARIEGLTKRLAFLIHELGIRV